MIDVCSVSKYATHPFYCMFMYRLIDTYKCIYIYCVYIIYIDYIYIYTSSRYLDFLWRHQFSVAGSESSPANVAWAWGPQGLSVVGGPVVAMKTFTS